MLFEIKIKIHEQKEMRIELKMQRREESRCQASQGPGGQKAGELKSDRRRVPKLQGSHCHLSSSSDLHCHLMGYSRAWRS